MKSFDPTNSTFRMVIWTHDGDCKVFYSFLAIEKKKGLLAAVMQLEALILGKFLDNHNCAIIYKNNAGKSGDPIIKYVSGKKEFDHRDTIQG